MEFFIRDQIVHEADLEGDFDTKRRMLRVFRKLANTVIIFLAQIEDAQKRLFEKKKFILRTDYLVSVKNIPRNLWSEVLANKAQLVEWKDLFAFEPKSDIFNFKGKINEYVLEQHPTIVVDTRHFLSDFTARLLVAVDDIDERTDGVLIKGENFQALNLLQEKYREQVKCIHIDPPYNTDTSGFLYKNCYRHASWLTMMADRFNVAIPLIGADGHLLCHIDENEYERLKILLDYQSIPDAGTVVWDKRNPMTARRGIATQHEYIVWRSFTERSIYQRNTNIVEMLRAAETIIKRGGGVTDGARRKFSEWVRKNTRLSGGEKSYLLLRQ